MSTPPPPIDPDTIIIDSFGYLVPSDSQPTRYRRVTADGCSCPAHGPCRHMLAVEALAFPTWSLADLAAADLAYQRRVECGDRLSAYDLGRWESIATNWMDAKFGTREGAVAR